MPLAGDPDDPNLSAAIQRWAEQFGWADLATATFYKRCAAALGPDQSADHIRRICAREMSLLLYQQCLYPADTITVQTLCANLARFARARLDPSLDASELAHDCLSDILMRITHINQPERFIGYCHSAVCYAVITRNTELRKQDKTLLSLDDLADADLDGDTLPTALEDVDAMRANDVALALKTVWSALERAPGLSDRERMVCLLRTRHALTSFETARLMRVSRNSVDSALSKALKKLRHAPELLRLWTDMP